MDSDNNWIFFKKRVEEKEISLLLLSRWLDITLIRLENISWVSHFYILKS